MRSYKFLLLFLVSSLFFHGSVLAQPSQGTFHVGGASNLGFTVGSSTSITETSNETNEQEGPNVTNFTLRPTAGYFLMDGLAAGLNISLNANSSKGTRTEFVSTNNGFKEKEVDYKNTSFSWTVGPYARYYTSFNLFGSAGIGLGTRSSSSYVDGDETEESKNDEADGVVRWHVGAGYALFVGGNQQVAIEPMLAYNHRRVSFKPVEDPVESRVETSGNFGLNLSISVFL
ncbi:MAG: hypothetical protein ABEH38_01755 [Flavobacteriales bacterium]